MIVDDVMSLPKNRRPSATEAVCLMLLRDKANRELVPGSFAAMVEPLDQTRDAMRRAHAVAMSAMSTAYEAVCREAGGIGTVHAVESIGGAKAVRELVAKLLASRTSGRWVGLRRRSLRGPSLAPFSYSHQTASLLTSSGG